MGRLSAIKVQLELELYMAGHVIVEYMWLLAAILAATGGYRWLLVTIYGWSCYSEYVWLLEAILAATGIPLGWGLRVIWRLYRWTPSG